MKCVLVLVAFLASSIAEAHDKTGQGDGYFYTGLAHKYGRSSSTGVRLVSGARALARQAIPAAIRSLHKLQYGEVSSTGSISPATVQVGSHSLPLMILFRSSSSKLNVQQAHHGASGSSQQSSSEDEPHRLIHSVSKPIIQEVREFIIPYRKITQEIQPVQQQVETIVTRHVPQAIAQSGVFPLGGNLGLGGSIPPGVTNSLFGSGKSLAKALKGKTADSYRSGVENTSTKSY